MLHHARLRVVSCLVLCTLKLTKTQSYFRSLNINLRFPQLGCVRVSKIAWYPLECVTVLPGSKFMGKLSPDQVAKVLECAWGIALLTCVGGITVDATL